MESVMTTSTPTAADVNLILLEQTARRRLTILLGINVEETVRSISRLVNIRKN